MENPQQPPQDKVGDDLLIGASAIADELNVSADAVYYIFKKKKLKSITKWGAQLISSRRKLRREASNLTGTI
jgi:hypothetical protein